LKKKAALLTTPAQTDLRRLEISLTAGGRIFTFNAVETAHFISDKTATNLSPRELERLLALLDKL
jgi:hypothetical protein